MSALCSNNPSVTVDDQEIDISAACLVLANWDFPSNLDSIGAHIFREFLRETKGGGSRWLPTSFNYALALTPRGLNISENPEVLIALAKAVQKFDLADKQFVDIPFELKDVARNATSALTLTEGSDDCAHDGWRSFTAQHFEDQAACEAHFNAVFTDQVTEFISNAW